MEILLYTHEQLVKFAHFTTEDIKQVNLCRRQHNRLGFGYQLSFIRLLNRFPLQQPFEILDDILVFVSVQLNIPSPSISDYAQRQPTISNHQENIRSYLGLQKLGNNSLEKVEQFVFERISISLSQEFRDKLDQLIRTSQNRSSALHGLKLPPGRPSPKSILKLTNKIEKIKETSVLETDLSWLNNSLQRSFTRYARQSTATKLRR